MTDNAARTDVQVELEGLSDQQVEAVLTAIEDLGGRPSELFSTMGVEDLQTVAESLVLIAKPLVAFLSGLAYRRGASGDRAAEERHRRVSELLQNLPRRGGRRAVQDADTGTVFLLPDEQRLGQAEFTEAVRQMGVYLHRAPSGPVILEWDEVQHHWAAYQAPQQ